MKKITVSIYITLIAIILLGCSSPNNGTRKQVVANTTTEKNIKHLPVSAEETQQRLAISKPIVNSWIDSMKAVAEKSGQKDLWEAIHIANNKSYAMPVEYNNQPAGKLLTVMPDPSHNGIVFTVITKDDKAKLPLWRARLQKTNFACSYDQGSVLIEESVNNKMANKYLKGLILFHELRHWSQDVVQHKTDPNLRVVNEVEAYDFEFTILDNLKLPGYDEFIRQETKSANAGFDLENSYLNDPRIEPMFGSYGSEDEKMMIGTELWYRVVFKRYEQNPSTEMENKLKFLSRIYGSRLQ